VERKEERGKRAASGDLGGRSIQSRGRLRWLDDGPPEICGTVTAFADVVEDLTNFQLLICPNVIDPVGGNPYSSRVEHITGRRVDRE